MSQTIGLSPAVRAYIQAANRDEPPALARCRAHAQTLGELAAMQISPEQGAFLQLLATMTNARDALEIGVFTGYSAVAVALAMQARHGEKARLVACDLSVEYMNRAIVTFEEAGVSGVVEPRVGPALDSLEALLQEDEANAFDLAFIDADKTGYPAYYDLVLRLLRPGGVMVFDNVLWSGKVADPSVTDADTAALRAVADRAKEDSQVDLAFTSIGDGLLICVKR